MNFKKFINSDYLKSNPLCGIDTYKDELNLATGACERKIKKLVLDGREKWSISHAWKKTNTSVFYFGVNDLGGSSENERYIVSTHFASKPRNELYQNDVEGIGKSGSNSITVRVDDTIATTVSEFTAWLRDNNVTIYYVLASPATETITVPTGLSGTEEGYLNQSSTPTPTNPIYPTANTVEKWFDLNHYIMKTATDTITTLPANIYPNDTTATVGLKGQMVQSSTPSPTAPIQPSECGERTRNLWNEDYTGIDGNLKYVPVFVGEGTFTLSTNTSSYSGNAPLFLLSGNVTSGASTSINGVYNGLSRTTSSSNGYITIVFRRQSESSDPSTHNTMLNSGSTALPYEPYGYKIPISSANTTTPVYLGEVESTRQIVKLVLDGNTSINYYAGGASKVGFVTQGAGLLGNRILGKCTHFQVQSTGVGSTIDGVTFGINNSTIYFTFSAASVATYNLSDIASIKQYLADQYSAGAPVTVWYVLAEPTTGIVNEPLRKIGDYADTVSGITIPTIAGADSFDVLTTLKPSEVTVNYKGWHPVQSVHERESGQWD